MPKDATPFSYVLGKEFETLPEPLRRFLSEIEEKRYEGQCSVTRGSSLFSKFVGLIMGLPKAGMDMPFELSTQISDKTMVWRRSFEGKALTTRASAAGRRGQKKLTEKAGPATLAMRLAIENDQLVFRSAGARFLGLPLPGFIAPRVEAFGFVEDENIIIESTTTLGRRRRLLRYQVRFDQTPVGEAKKTLVLTDAEPPAEEVTDPTIKPNDKPSDTPKDKATATPAEGSVDETVVMGHGTKTTAAAEAGPPDDDETVVAGRAVQNKQTLDEQSRDGRSQLVPRPAAAGVATKPMRRENARRPDTKAEAEPPPAPATVQPEPPKNEPPEPASRPHPAEAGDATVPLRPSRKRGLPQSDAKK